MIFIHINTHFRHLPNMVGTLGDRKLRYYAISQEALNLTFRILSAAAHKVDSGIFFKGSNYEP